MNGHHDMYTIMSQFDDIYDTISQYRNTSNMMIQYDDTYYTISPYRDIYDTMISYGDTSNMMVQYHDSYDTPYKFILLNFETLKYMSYESWLISFAKL
jgi:hypothetical protein